MNDANQAVLENIFERKFVCRISIDTLFTECLKIIHI